VTADPSDHDRFLALAVFSIEGLEAAYPGADVRLALGDGGAFEAIEVVRGDAVLRFGLDGKAL